MALWRLRGGGALAGYVGGVTSELFRARVIWTARLVGVTLIYTVFAGMIAFRRTPPARALASAR